MLIPEIADRAKTPEFRKHLVDLLVKLIGYDTTIRADVDGMRKAESEVFDVLEGDIKASGLPGVKFERRAINPKIADHPFFSQLYYTRSPKNPKGLTAEQCYAGRSNMLVCVDGNRATDAGVNQAVNTHIDVVQPYFPARVEGDTVYGRGACDDKGNAVAMCGALTLVAEYLKKTGKKLNRNLTYMFVIDEEMGGNGSLSCAIDRDLKKRYDSLVVMEICESKLYPGNRGCVWFRIEAKVPNVNLFEAAAYIIEEIEKEGRSIRSESNHPLFPHRPVQTCHGIIGACGEHPSRINGKVSFNIRFDGSNPEGARKTITDAIEFALNEYCGVYGDKTKVNDKTTGKPKVDHHYDIAATADGFTVTVHGSTGHMGSIFENDGSITKMMTMVRSLIRSRSMIVAKAGASGVSFHLDGWKDDSHLIMEGGQGFLPTHEMSDVQNRLNTAVKRGADYYFRMAGHDVHAKDHFSVTYEKLHNAAFAGSTDSSDMLNAIACAKATGMWKDADYAQGIRGWDVSCDSRIFAKEYEGELNVITTGPGSLVYAHSDREQMNIPEMVKFAEFLAHYILKQTGTI